jgi:hypothetical protein
MEYKYHCQPQAEEFAKQIIPVPDNYPLRNGLPDDYRIHYAKLCELMKEMYLDMTKKPESYGLKLIEISSQDRHAIRAAQNKIHRLVDTLLRLCQSGRVENHQLIVSADLFKSAIKKAQGAVSNSVPKYELILSRLTEFGFDISDFTGKPFDKNVESFTIEYPDDPDIIDTMKTYFDCWDILKENQANVIMWNEFHHNFYRFDYKVTADHDKLSGTQWVHDKALRYGYPPEIDKFYVAFHEYSLKYKKIRFDGEYYYKSKRIARSLDWGNEIPKLALILKDMDKYITVIEAMPDSVKKPFTKSSCNYCGFQGATDEHCKFRRIWTLDGIKHDACAFFGFQFDDFDVARVADYWQLLELEYGLN